MLFIYIYCISRVFTYNSLQPVAGGCGGGSGGGGGGGGGGCGDGGVGGTDCHRASELKW